MASYTYPGVYVEEQPAPQSIQGASTSTAGFVGVTRRGEVGKAHLVTSFADFRRKLGGHMDRWPGEDHDDAELRQMGDRPYLSYAAQAFFENGGQQLYVSRVVSDEAEASRLKLRSHPVTRLAADTAEDREDRDQVQLVDLRGVQVGTDLTFTERIRGEDRSQTREVMGYDARTGRVYLNAPLDERFTADGCTVKIGSGPDNPDFLLKVRALSPGDWGDDLMVRTYRADAPRALAKAWDGRELEVEGVQIEIAGDGPDQNEKTFDIQDDGALSEGDELRLVASEGDDEYVAVRVVTEVDPDGSGGATITLDEEVDHDFSAPDAVLRQVVARAGDSNPEIPLTDVIDVGGEEAVVRLKGRDGRSTLKVDTPVTSTDEVTLDTGHYTLRQDIHAGDTLVVGAASSGDSLHLNATGRFYEGAVIEVDDGTFKQYARVKKVRSEELELDADLDQVAQDATVSLVEFDLQLEGPDESEYHQRLALVEDAARYAETVIDRDSSLVEVEVKTTAEELDAAQLAFSVPTTEGGGAESMDQGSLGGVPSSGDIVGEDRGPGYRTGLEVLKPVDDISLIAAPGVSHSEVQRQLLGQCERLQYRFAVLDPQPGSTMATNEDDDVIVQRNEHDSLYGALYYPWLKRVDPTDDDDRQMLVPPSGYVLGCYARTDTDRGVHKAPANVVVRGVSDVEFNLTDREQGVLNPNNINVIRDLRSKQRGIRVWGARCITSDDAWKYVPVRRTFIFIEESLDEGLQWVVFEPNGPELWAEVRRVVSNFLRGLWEDGALAGRSEEEAFFVQCDETTMSEDQRAAGQLVVEIGVAPLHPAEFVIIRIGQKTLESQG